MTTEPTASPPLKLASEALRDDLAPSEPLASLVRRFCLLLASLLALGGALLGASGAAMALRDGLEGATAALVVLGLGLSPLPYGPRSHGLAGLGVAMLLAALLGHGPAGGLLRQNPGALPWELARVLAAVLLPAALLFRAHYRALPLARLLLGWGLVLALPFAMRSCYLVAMATAWSERLAAGLTLTTTLFALLGFMGAHTTAGGSLWAAGLLVSLALDIAARLLLPGESPRLALHIATALGFLVSAALASFGLFQAFAHALAPAARLDAERRWRRGWIDP